MKQPYILMATCALVIPSAAAAQQVETYAYDVHGRLVSMVRASGSTNQTTTYGLDKTDNRTARNTGAPTAGLMATDAALEVRHEQEAMPATKAGPSLPDQKAEALDEPRTEGNR